MRMTLPRPNRTPLSRPCRILRGAFVAAGEDMKLGIRKRRICCCEVRKWVLPETSYCLDGHIGCAPDAPGDMIMCESFQARYSPIRVRAHCSCRALVLPSPRPF